MQPMERSQAKHNRADVASFTIFNKRDAEFLLQISAHELIPGEGLENNLTIADRHYRIVREGQQVSIILGNSLFVRRLKLKAMISHFGSSRTSWRTYTDILRNALDVENAIQNQLA
jgi:hypothetical protein